MEIQDYHRLDKEQKLALLIQTLLDPDPDKRRWAAEGLKLKPDVRAVEPLIAALKDENETVLDYVTSALGNTLDKRAVEPLLELLYAGNASAAYALATIQDERAFQPLLNLLQSSDSRLRRSAVIALGMFGDKRAIRPLIHLLQSESDEDTRW